MLLFIIVSIFLLCGALIPPRSQGIYLFVSFIVLFIMMAYRDLSVGTDTLQYETIFRYIEADYDWVKSAIEPSWALLNSIVVYFGGDFRDFLVLTSLIVLIPIFLIARRYSQNPMFSIFLYYLLYFYFYAFNITRQAVAINIVLLALVALIKQKRLYFILLVLVASTFHYSALVILPVLLVNRISSNNAVLISITAISMISGLLLPSYILSIIKSTIYSYAFNYSLGNFFGNFLSLLMYNSLFLFILLTTKDKEIKFKLFFIFIILLNLTARIPFGNRLLLYIAIFQIIFYPYYIASLKSKNQNYKVLVILVFITFFYIHFYRIFGAGEITPYINILF